jgi:hypothetical protein
MLEMQVWRHLEELGPVGATACAHRTERNGRHLGRPGATQRRLVPSDCLLGPPHASTRFRA